VQVPHAGTRKGGLSVQRDPCCSPWLLLSQSPRSPVWGLWRTKADISGNSDSSCRSSHYAVACERETTAIRSYRRRSVEGGPCSVGAVCLPLTHLPGGTGNQCDLARKVAEPIAALVVLLLVVREGREAIRGKGYGCC